MVHSVSNAKIAFYQFKAQVKKMGPALKKLSLRIVAFVKEKFKLLWEKIKVRLEKISFRAKKNPTTKQQPNAGPNSPTTPTAPSSVPNPSNRTPSGNSKSTTNFTPLQPSVSEQKPPPRTPFIAHMPQNTVEVFSTTEPHHEEEKIPSPQEILDLRNSLEEFTKVMTTFVIDKKMQNPGDEFERIISDVIRKTNESLKKMLPLLNSIQSEDVVSFGSGVEGLLNEVIPDGKSLVHLPSIPHEKPEALKRLISTDLNSLRNRVTELRNLQKEIREARVQKEKVLVDKQRTASIVSKDSSSSGSETPPLPLSRVPDLESFLSALKAKYTSYEGLIEGILEGKEYNSPIEEEDLEVFYTEVIKIKNEISIFEFVYNFGRLQELVVTYSQSLDSFQNSTLEGGENPLLKELITMIKVNLEEVVPPLLEVLASQITRLGENYSTFFDQVIIETVVGRHIKNVEKKTNKTDSLETEATKIAALLTKNVFLILGLDSNEKVIHILANLKAFSTFTDLIQPVDLILKCFDELTKNPILKFEEKGASMTEPSLSVGNQDNPFEACFSELLKEVPLSKNLSPQEREKAFLAFLKKQEEKAKTSKESKKEDFLQNFLNQLRESISEKGPEFIENLKTTIKNFLSSKIQELLDQKNIDRLFVQSIFPSLLDSIVTATYETALREGPFQGAVFKALQAGSVPAKEVIQNHLSGAFPTTLNEDQNFTPLLEQKREEFSSNFKVENFLVGCLEEISLKKLVEFKLTIPGASFEEIKTYLGDLLVAKARETLGKITLSNSLKDPIRKAVSSFLSSKQINSKEECLAYVNNLEQEQQDSPESEIYEKTFTKILKMGNFPLKVKVVDASLVGFANIGTIMKKLLKDFRLNTNKTLSETTLFLERETYKLESEEITEELMGNVEDIERGLIPSSQKYYEEISSLYAATKTKLVNRKHDLANQGQTIDSEPDLDGHLARILFDYNKNIVKFNEILETLPDKVASENSRLADVEGEITRSLEELQERINNCGEIKNHLEKSLGMFDTSAVDAITKTENCIADMTKLIEQSEKERLVFNFKTSLLKHRASLLFNEKNTPSKPQKEALKINRALYTQSESLRRYPHYSLDKIKTHLSKTEIDLGLKNIKEENSHSLPSSKSLEAELAALNNKRETLEKEDLAKSSVKVKRSSSTPSLSSVGSSSELGASSGEIFQDALEQPLSETLEVLKLDILKKQAEIKRIKKTEKEITRLEEQIKEKRNLQVRMLSKIAKISLDKTIQSQGTLTQLFVKRPSEDDLYTSITTIYTKLFGNPIKTAVLVENLITEISGVLLKPDHSHSSATLQDRVAVA